MKKLLAVSLFLLLGAGCSGAVTADGNPVIDGGVEVQAEPMVIEGAEGVDDTIDVTVQADADVEVSPIASVEILPAAKTFAVSGDNFTFAPATMSVKKGDTVRITFTNDEGFHDLKIDAFDVATAKLNAGATETIEFVADEAGTFEYYCSVGSHRAMGMKGTLTVE